MGETPTTSKIFVTGCLHGGWDLLLDTVEEIVGQGDRIDLVLITGDAQTMRTEDDLLSYSAPQKYRVMGSFYKLYTGERKSKIPILIVGGNHEACDFLHLLPFGGWLAPNVFYAGRANSLKCGDITMSFLSGLYKPQEYFRKVDEKFPLRDYDMKTAYHIRAFSDFQLLGLENTQLIITHEWPATIPSQYGGHYLQKRRPDLVKEDKNKTFGLSKGIEMIKKLKPSVWFASHHHITFHTNVDQTQFIALPKQTRSDWFLVADIEGSVGELKYRGEWISILKATTEEMDDPSILRNCDWEEKWNSKKENMVQCPDQCVGAYEIDPYEYTSAFCSKNDIYCPIVEIRNYISQKMKNG